MSIANFCELQIEAKQSKQVLLNIAGKKGGQDETNVSLDSLKQHIVFASGDAQVIFLISFHLPTSREGIGFSDIRAASSAVLCEYFLSFDKVWVWKNHDHCFLLR